MPLGIEKMIDKDKKQYGHPGFYERLEEEGNLHSNKNRDYTAGVSSDPLSNFHRVSAILKIWGFDIPPSLVAIIYSLKQEDAHMWMKSQGFEGKVEGSHQRLMDKSVYSKIIDILEEEEKIPPEKRFHFDPIFSEDDRH